MHISPLQFKNIQNYKSKPNNTFEKKQFHQAQYKNTQQISYDKQYYLSFQGGRSLSLKETIERLDELNIEYPKEVRQAAMAEIEIGNPNDKTLIDIHRDVYKDLSIFNQNKDSAISLYDAKVTHPEFKTVLPDSLVDFKNNNFLNAAANGQIEVIDPDSDISFQLLQLYWGEGYSINQLNDYFNDYADDNIGKINVYDALVKFNIPRVNPTYGHYLRLSDKQFNDEMTKHLSEILKSRSKQILRKAKEYNNHKGNTGIYRDKEDIAYYKRNPLQRKIAYFVGKRAWGYPEANPIRKAMSKYFKKQNELNAKEIMQLVEEGDKAQSSNTLKTFWKENPKFKQVMSKCMEKAWKRQDELMEMNFLDEPLYVFTIFPDEFIADVDKYYSEYSGNILRKCGRIGVLPNEYLDREEEIFAIPDETDDYLRLLDNLLDNDKEKHGIGFMMNEALHLSFMELFINACNNKDKKATIQDLNYMLKVIKDMEEKKINTAHEEIFGLKCSMEQCKKLEIYIKNNYKLLKNDPTSKKLNKIYSDFANKILDYKNTFNVSMQDPTVIFASLFLSFNNAYEKGNMFACARLNEKIQKILEKKDKIMAASQLDLSDIYEIDPNFDNRQQDAMILLSDESHEKEIEDLIKNYFDHARFVSKMSKY